MDFFKKHFIALLFFLGVSSMYASFAGASYGDGTNLFMELLIQESKTSQSLIEFSLIKATALSGNYNATVFPYNPIYDSNYYYEIQIKNKNGILLGRYNARSSRFSFYDGKNSGGIKESDNGIMKLVMPYNSSNPIAKVSIKTNTGAISITLPKLNFLPCVKLNNKWAYGQAADCCAGLAPGQQADGTYICVNCGDGKCSKYENEENCNVDCKKPIAKNSIMQKILGSLASAVLTLARVFK